MQRLIGEVLTEYALFLKGRNTSGRHKRDEEQQARKAVTLRASATCRCATSPAAM